MAAKVEQRRPVRGKKETSYEEESYKDENDELVIKKVCTLVLIHVVAIQ